MSEPITRPEWDVYHMRKARFAAERGSCARLQVGAVIIDGDSNRLLADGYNGSLPGDPHCLDAGCLMVDGHCVRTIHAELNAFGKLFFTGPHCKNLVLYTTAFPCWRCAQQTILQGVKRIVYSDAYRTDELVVQACMRHKVELVQVQVIAPVWPDRPPSQAAPFSRPLHVAAQE